MFGQQPTVSDGVHASREISANVMAADQQDKDTSTMMSSIQILGTLPQRQQMNGQIQLQELPVQNQHPPNQQQQQQTQHVAEDTFNYNHTNAENWDFDLMQQDMSWLGRLPVYTDLESEYQNTMNGQGWGGFSFL